MKTSSNMMFLLMMMLSTISVMNSSTWLNMWVCLEINMMSFIPLIYNYKNMYMSQSMMMYFLIQSMSSMIFISSIMINNYLMNWSELIELVIMLTMMVKMGMPPMHLWFVQIMSKLSWTMCLILLTWQKMAPMYIMSTVIKMNNMTLMIICLSTIIGAIYGLNQTSTQKIMAYSSINHLGWMMACSACHKKSWIIYLMLYSLIMIITCVFFNMYNIMYINQTNTFSFQMMDKIMIMCLMLSLGGIPPFLGFIPKWLAIQYMISSNEIIIMMIMTVSSLITLAYYLRMISSINLMICHSQKWMLLSPNLMMMSLLFINNMLPMMIILLNLF